jgi:hypothetical protein
MLFSSVLISSVFQVASVIFICIFAETLIQTIMIMYAEALKTILKLQRENTLLRKAISDAIVRLSTNGKCRLSSYGDDDISSLFSCIDSEIKNKQQ